MFREFSKGPTLLMNQRVIHGLCRPLVGFPGMAAQSLVASASCWTHVVPSRVCVAVGGMCICPCPRKSMDAGRSPRGGGRGWGGKFDFFPVSFLGKKKSKMVKKTELGDGCCWFSTHLKLFNTLDYFFEWDINEIDGGSVWRMGYEGMNFFT